MPHRHALAALAAAAALSLPSPSAVAADIAWHASVDEAFAAALERKAPVFVAINMDGERANDEAVETLYREKTIVDLAGLTAPLFASRFDHDGGDRSCRRAPGSTTCDAHRAIEKEIRKRYLMDQGDQVIAPQHLWLAPDGTVLLSVPYRVSEGELEWCFVEALKRLDPSFSRALSPSARAPKRLLVGGVRQGAEDGAGPVLSKKEVLALIEELKKIPPRELMDRVDDIVNVLRSDEKAAIDYVDGLLSAGGGGAGRGGRGPGAGLAGLLVQRKVRLLQSIGRLSPPAYHEIVEPLLGDDAPELRANAAVTLELLAAPKSLGALTKAWKKEEDPTVRRELARAIGSCGRDGKGESTLRKAWDSRREDVQVRASAVVGVGHLEDRDAVLEVARSALFAADPEVRVAAACVVGVRREEGLRAVLEEVRGSEADEGVKKAFDAALEALKGGDAGPLETFLREATGSDLPRDRIG